MEKERFEYLTDVYPERELQVRLDELGTVGWELITAKWEEFSFGGRTHQQARCILKRRVTPTLKSIFDDPDDIEEYEPALKSFSAS